MSERTKEDLENELAIIKALKEERACSNSMYAIKLVEVVVWGLVGIILTSVAIAIVALVI